MRLKVFGVVFAALLLIGCGSTPTDDKSAEIKNRIAALESISESISAMVYSDFASCPASGDTADALIRKICEVAQASTIEAQYTLKSELLAYINQLRDQIVVINADLAKKQDMLDGLAAQLGVLESSLSTLNGRMTSAESAISALQTLTASINGTLNGAMVAVDIGSENASAGPVYETVLRRVDRTRFTGYVQAYDAWKTLGNNPLTASNGSSTLTVSLNAHGYLAGDRVELDELVGSRGFSNGHLKGTFVVQTANTNTFTIQASVSASSSGTLGGNTPGLVRKVLGEGMGTLWASGDASDSVVRVSNLGTKRYNFIIRRKSVTTTAELCYSKTSNTANFATINAAPEGGNATITCK